MNPKLWLRFTAPSVLIGLALFGACLAGAWYIHRLQTNLAGLLTQTVRSLQAAQELEIRVRQLRFHMVVYLSEPREERLKPVELDQQHFEEALAVARQTAATPEQQACVGAIEEQYKRYHDEQAELRSRVAAGKEPGPLTELVNPQPLHLVIEPSQELLRLNLERMDQVAEESRQAGEHGNLALLLLGVAGLVSGLVMGYGAARGLSHSIYRLSVRVQDMAHHLDRDVGSVSVVADGDLHNLDRQLAHIVQRVEEVAERLQQHQRELIRAEQLSAVGQLAASVAHEVRNPLTSMKLLVESALRSNNSKPLNLEDLQVIHREIARLEQTVQGFLNFARLPTPLPQPLRDLGGDVWSSRPRNWSARGLGSSRLRSPCSSPLKRSRRTSTAANLKRCSSTCSSTPWMRCRAAAGSKSRWAIAAKPARASRSPTRGAAFRRRSPPACLRRSRRPSRQARGWGLPSRGVSSKSMAAASRRPIGLKAALVSSSVFHPDRQRPNMPTLLVVDDEESVRYTFRRLFHTSDVEVRTAADAAAGLEAITAQPPDVIVLDLQLPDMSGLDLYRAIHPRLPKCPVIFITSHGTTEAAIEAMKGGAFDYLVKPVDLDRLSQVIDRAFEAVRLMSAPAVLPSEDVSDRIVGRCPVMQEMCKAIGRIAPQDVNVLILGESGTGKELVARALYQHSRRAGQPFLAVNCAAIPETLLESELFGHEKGAFTGADRRRIGKFEQCSGGTLFLDEIGDMTPGLQAKMLRVLQDQRFERVGGGETLQTQVRILTATNQDLPKLVSEGRFRKDLYYRLNAVTIQVPPLRARQEDTAELAHYFLFRFNRELNMDLRALAPETLQILEAFHWPGNVRELQGVIKQAMLNASGHILAPEFLPEYLSQAPPPQPVSEAPGSLDLQASRPQSASVG